MRSDPHSWFDPAQGVTREITLWLSADFDAHVLSGTARLAFREPLAGGPLDLDTRDLEIRAVRAATGPAGPAPVPFALDLADPILGHRLRIDAPRGATTIEIDYATRPAASALQWLSPAQTAGGKRPFLFSQAQAIHARSIVPLQDSPAARIVYRAEIDVPKGLRALMSAASTHGRKEIAGRTTYAFQMEQSIPPYLLALAVGDLHGKDLGRRSRVWAEREVLDRAAWEFADVPRMMEAAERLFGPYDWERFDLLVMPPSFPYGGMENPRITFLTPTLLAGDRSLVDVVAHELAHSWTGNLVSNASANDFWLNEGFTVYAERRIVEALHGPERAAIQARVGRLTLEEDLRRFGDGSPLTRLRTELAGVDPDEVFSLVPYEKGYLFLVCLERAAGRAEFDRFLRRYLTTYRFRSITTADFLGTLEAELPGLSARVDAGRWIDGAGLPGDAPTFSAPTLDAVDRLSREWTTGRRPTAEEARAWTSDEWQLYLRGLPRPIGGDDCRTLDERFALTGRGNMEVLVAWLELAVASGYAPAVERTTAVLRSVGRMKYLKPLYRALLSRPETVALARETFAAAEAGYHAIAAAGIRGILAAAENPAPEPKP